MPQEPLDTSVMDGSATTKLILEPCLEQQVGTPRGQPSGRVTCFSGQRRSVTRFPPHARKGVGKCPPACWVASTGPLPYLRACSQAHPCGEGWDPAQDPGCCPGLFTTPGPLASSSWNVWVPLLLAADQGLGL